MASSKVMPSTSNSTNSDLTHHHRNHNHSHYNRNHHHNQLQSQMIPDFASNGSDLHQQLTDVDGMLRDVVYDDVVVPPENSAFLDAEIALIDAAGAISAIGGEEAVVRRQISERKTVEEVWREIVEGKECKVEAVDEMMTLEDFLAKAGAGAGEEELEDEEVKVGVSGGLFGFDQSLVQNSYHPPQQPMPSVMVYGNDGGCGGGGARGKRRGGPILEPLDKAAQQRQKRMIKNRESAARSRERKQAYQVELESLAAKLEEENEQLLKEKAERTNERLKQLMERVVPVVEKKRPPRVLRRVRSMQW